MYQVRDLWGHSLQYVPVCSCTRAPLTAAAGVIAAATAVAAPVKAAGAAAAGAVVAATVAISLRSVLSSTTNYIRRQDFAAVSLKMV